MYSFFLDGMLFPVAPSRLKLKIKGQNQTVTLLNEGQISILKSPGLTEISGAEFLLPALAAYPFSYYPEGFRPPEYFLARLEGIMIAKTPVRFLVSRVSPAGKLLFFTHIPVSLENYTVTEDAKNGQDIMVSLDLRQYRKFTAKRVTVDRLESATLSGAALTVGQTVDFLGTTHYISSTADTGSACAPGKARLTLISAGARHPYHLVGEGLPGGSSVHGWVDASGIAGAEVSASAYARVESAAPREELFSGVYTVREGDTLWSIARKCTGDGSRYIELYEAVKNTVRHPYRLTPGEELILPW